MECMHQAHGPDNRMSVGAVLLAAGAGSRMGGKPKSLLELGGVPLVTRQLIALTGAGVDEVVVVLGHHAPAIEAAVQEVMGRFPVTLVHNPAPDEGQASSVRLGLQALSLRVDAVLVALADQPLIDAQDITTLIGAFRKRGDKSMVVPLVKMSDGRKSPGNPVILDAALRAQWLAGSANLTGRQWRENHPDRVSWLETENQHYRMDIDTPEDLQRFEQTTGQRLVWPQVLEA